MTSKLKSSSSVKFLYTFLKMCVHLKFLGQFQMRRLTLQEERMQSTRASKIEVSTREIPIVFFFLSCRQLNVPVDIFLAEQSSI